MNASVNISRFMERAESFGESLNSFLCVHRVSVVKNFRVEDRRDAMDTEKAPFGRASKLHADLLAASSSPWLPH